MGKKEKKELLDWISGGKSLFPEPPPGFFKYMKREDLGDNNLFMRMNDLAIVQYEEVKRAEKDARSRNEPFEVCHMIEIVFPGPHGDDAT